MTKIVKVKRTINGQVFYVNTLVEVAEPKSLAAHRERNEDIVNAEAATEALAIRRHRAIASDRQKLAF